MAETVIEVHNISKIYRLGTKETEKKGFISVLTSIFLAPFENYKKLRNLSQFSDQNDEDTLWALKDISFSLQKGEVLGVIGKNGGGKSTLLKILSRVTDPTLGHAKIYGRVASLLEVGTGFHPDLTGTENVYLNGTILGMTKKEVEDRMDDIIEFSGIEKYMETPIKRYSSGMKVRLAFAVAAHLDPDILIIDEVLAVGDFEFQRKCLGKMNQVAQGGRTVIFVSHDMAAVKSLCTRAIMLKKGVIAAQGDVKEVVNAYLSAEGDFSSGEITEDAKRPYGYSDARFLNVRVVDQNKETLNLLHYRQNFTVLMHLEVFKTLGNVAVELEVCALDGTILSCSSMLESERNGISLQQGTYAFELEIESRFLPGEYILNPCVRTLDGVIIDKVENAFKFSVLIASEVANKHFPWKHVNGYVRAESEWKLPVEIKYDVPILEG